MLARAAATTPFRPPVRSAAVTLQLRSMRGRGYAESGIDMLKKDHKEVSTCLFGRPQKSNAAKVFEMLDVMKTRSGAEAKAIMNKITEELSKHAAVEEQVFQNIYFIRLSNETYS